MDKIDVCELVKNQGGEALERVIDAAAPYIDYLIERIPEGISHRELISEVDGVLAELVGVEPTLTGIYLKEIAGRFGVGKRDLNKQFKEIETKHQRKQTEQQDEADTDRRPEIIVNNRQMRTIRRRTADVLLSANQRLLDDAAEGTIRPGDMPICFNRANGLVRLSHEEHATVIRPMDIGALKTILTEIADWVKVSEYGTKASKPPQEIPDGLISLPPHDLPKLETIIGTPVFDSTGALIVRSGYHEAERTWLQLAKGFTLPEIPEAPTAADMARAKEWIFNDMFVDFPFVNQADRAMTAAALLLPFLRKMVDGPTPLHMIEAPTKGTGKGKICHLISIVATGDVAHAQALPRDVEETRKTFTAELAAGKQIVLLDNADERRVINNPVLASVLTSEIWRDRLLKESVKLSLHNYACWFLTGNNPRVSGEIARRCVRIRMVPEREDPWLRDDFKHKPIENWAKQNRGELVWSVLTLVQAWIAAGRPAGTQTLGSFESWAEIMGGVLDVVGIDGFLGNLDDLYADTDSEGEIWRELVTAWWEAFKGEPQRINVLNDFCERHDLMTGVRGDKGERSQQTRLGNALRRARDGVYGDFRILQHSSKEARFRRTYYLVRIIGHESNGGTTPPDARGNKSNRDDQNAANDNFWDEPVTSEVEGDIDPFAANDDLWDQPQSKSTDQDNSTENEGIEY
ncbi:MAG: hypothetical protein GY854_34615 [Deltaproteobacteria bacterium]|nr:hypothetical protein [Deltaproteobacteria bacterium]